MRYLSVCSGIEAATCAWHPLAWQPVAFSEIEPFPSAVLAHHYPAVPNLGDMMKFKEWNIDSIDILVGGTPCQSFSVAGLRKGLDDPRGNLMLTYLAIADRFKPRWLVWENVPGVLSSNGGKDFGTFLGGLAELGYGFAYRVLDAQYFGIPQRRRRVFVVGYLGDWRRAAAVLFERHSMSGNPAPRREAGKGFAADFAPSLTASGRGVERTGESRGQDPVIAVARTTGTLNANGKAAGSATNQDAESGMLIVAPPLTGNPYGDNASRENMLVPSVAPCLTRNYGKQPDSSNTSAGPMLIPIAFDCKSSGQNGFGVGEIASTLRSMGCANSHQNGGGHLAIAAFKGGQGSAAGGIGYDENLSPTLSSADSGSNRTPTLMQGMQVRRLTVVECEKLQGFLPEYTRIPIRKYKERKITKTRPADMWEEIDGELWLMSADGPRYKALGNSMAVPVMSWIGKRIQMVEDIIQELEASV